MRTARAVIFEALLVAVVGLLLSLAANALSPRGLRLTRNYFPASEAPSPGRLAAGSSMAAVAGSGPTNAAEATLQRLRRHGLEMVGSNDVVALYRDPRTAQGLVVFIDARDDAHYAGGHIPSAWQFHHYRAEQFLPTVLPVCLNAMKVVVYCNGGECEDSEFAAIMLRDAGVPRDALVVYAGGITEWIANGLPVETGARGSGELLPRKP